MGVILGTGEGCGRRKKKLFHMETIDIFKGGGSTEININNLLRS